MDHNHEGVWPLADAAAPVQEWLLPGSGTDNALQSDPFALGSESRAAVQPCPAPPEIIVREIVGGISNRHAYLFVLGLGLILALLAVVISTRVLPRYADVQQRYGFQLPWETSIALRSGMVQPIPGCALIIAGLTGLLARKPSRRHALVTAILLLLALAVPLATAAALLIPELTLV